MDIKSRIKESGQTVSGVAKRMGITKSALSQTINGNPTFDKLCEIAEILGPCFRRRTKDNHLPPLWHTATGDGNTNNLKKTL